MRHVCATKALWQQGVAFSVTTWCGTKVPSVYSATNVNFHSAFTCVELVCLARWLRLCWRKCQRTRQSALSDIRHLMWSDKKIRTPLTPRLSCFAQFVSYWLWLFDRYFGGKGSGWRQRWRCWWWHAVSGSQAGELTVRPTEPGPLTVGTVKPIYRTGSPQECRGGNSPTRSPSNVSFCQISLVFFFSVKQGNIYVTICGTCVIFYFILLSFWKVWFRKQELVRVVQIKFLVDFPRSSSSLCLIASWPERCLSFTVLPVSTSVPDPLRSAFIFLLLFLYDWLILLTCHM